MSYKLNIISFCGLFGLLLIGWLCSDNRKKFDKKTVIGGLVFQFAMAILVFKIPASKTFFLKLNTIAKEALDAAAAGIVFVFGPLATAPGQDGSLGFILAIQGICLAIFFASFAGMLYYLGIMQWLVKSFAYIFNRIMNISGAESLCSAANIFVGSESTITIKPYLERMTKSELCTVLTACMATVASTTLGIYIANLQDVFPTIAGHLISASILSAPAAILMSKILYPETEHPVTLGKHAELYYEKESSMIEAIINGSTTGTKLAVGICASLIAFLGILALLDSSMLWLCHATGIISSDSLVTSPLQEIFSYVFKPLAMLMGVSTQDAGTVGELLGTRFTQTEIPAYLRLAELIKTGAITERTGVIAAYSLCGFAHLASLSIFIGGIAAIVPERRADLARVGIRALIAANLACLMTGCMAGIFFN